MSGWTAIAGSGSLGPRGRMRVMLDGAEYVLWRGVSGTPRLWGNRCPHRGMRLSFGLVRGEDLLCIYHGWRYGPSGACAAIPAHPDLDPPKTIAAEVFPVAEAHGLIWAGGTGASPELARLAGGRALSYCRSLHVDRPEDDLRSAMAETLPVGWTVEEASGRFLIVAAPDFAAVAAFHRLDAERSAVHLTAAGEVAAQVALARWIAGVRDRLEGAAA